MRTTRAVRTAIFLAFITLMASFIPVSAQTAGNGDELSITIGPAPIVPDGAVAGAPTDIVVTFVDRDPSVDGIGIKEGGTIEIVLPDEFINVGPQPGDATIILQGWPQSPPGPPPEWPWTFEIDGNTITTTMTEDFLPGDFGPGPKQAHLLVFSFQNPATPGSYDIDVTITPDPDSAETLSGTGSVFIHSAELPKVSAVSLFSGPPGPPPPFYNPIYQTIEQGDPARQVGLYLWGRNGAPMVGVSVQQVNGKHARLVQNGSTVGHIWVDGPKKAWGSTLSGWGPSGGPVSEEGLSFSTNRPVGIFIIQFTPDPNVSGDYTLRIRLNGGLSEKLYVSVIPSSRSLVQVRMVSDDSVVPASHSQLTRTEDGVSADLVTSGLEPGSAYTVWWMVFNHPEFCVDGCDSSDVDDVAAVDGTVLWADGGVINASGEKAFEGTLPANSDPTVDVRKGTGVLTNPIGAEIHLVVRNHGPVIDDLEVAQTTTFSGACDVNVCNNEQYAMHAP